ncbi:MAG: DUF4174 domain-containing protein [Rubrobacter sp.]|nr:DUF4174 domain-containing protein [Rubrobacter sp.]MDQ3362039.1 DUF4174 domain-containing protein [Actinomycetota bacterium]MDQ3377936.1 DUF4174 domain-containing protein [Actinomycetota bacterium]
MKGYPSTNRHLLVFAPSADHEAYASQRDLLEGHGAASEDRDLLAESFFEDGSEKSAAARSRFEVEDGAFTAVLVGKDGGEKFRSTEPVLPEKLFDLIDAMPMRRCEIRSRDPR